MSAHDSGFDEWLALIVVGNAHPTLRSDAHRYQESLEQMLDLDADLLLEGHFGIIEGKPAVRRFIRSYLY